MSADGIWQQVGGGAMILNQTGIPESTVAAALDQQGFHDVATVVRWGHQMQRGSLFTRDRYLTPAGVYDQFRTAYDAAHSDDVVSGVLELSENLAFGWLDMEASLEEEGSIWNQIAEDIDLPTRMKEIWRDLFITSNSYVATFWGRRTYKVQGRRLETGVKRKKTYNILAPIGLSVLDPLKVVPIGNFLFGQEQLAYIASRTEAEGFDRVLAGENTSDLVVLQLIQSRYEPSMEEKQTLGNLGVDTSNLYLLNPNLVWRITGTRATYERFAPVRMRSVFELLDLKNQLKAQDRALLLGATNFLVLIKIGSDKYPGKQAEVNAMRSQIALGSPVPVIVGDERIDVQIITPKTDMVLQPERYNVLDARISARLLNIFTLGNFQAGTKSDDSLKIAKLIARSLESRRSDLVRSVYKHVIKPTMEKNPALQSEYVRLQYHPKRIAIDLDSSLMMLLQNLRDRGDLSRESILDEVGYEQAEEAVKRERERVYFDEIFAPTQVPFDSPNKTMPLGEQKRQGRIGGGTNNGGGANQRSGVPKVEPDDPEDGG